MQRVDNDPSDLFENGNPTTSVEGTRVMAEWLNAIQEELCYIVEEAGLTIDTEDDTQILEALTRMFGRVAMNRAKFTRKDADEIYLGAFGCSHVGTREQIVYSNAQLTYQFSNLAASDWSYLYLDDSAIVTAGTNVITASELIDSTAEPTWSDAKHGWYNGNDRCIFAVLTDSSSNILSFFHEGNIVFFDTEIVDLNDADIDLVWTDVSLTLPKFSTIANIYFKVGGAPATTIAKWRTNGSTGSHEAGLDAITDVKSVKHQIVITDANQIIEVVHDVSDTSILKIATQAWHFSTGM